MSKAKSHRHTRRTDKQKQTLMHAIACMKNGEGYYAAKAARATWYEGCGYSSPELLRIALSRFAAKNIRR